MIWDRRGGAGEKWLVRLLSWGCVVGFEEHFGPNEAFGCIALPNPRLSGHLL